MHPKLFSLQIFLIVQTDVNLTNFIILFLFLEPFDRSSTIFMIIDKIMCREGLAFPFRFFFFIQSKLSEQVLS